MNMKRKQSEVIWITIWLFLLLVWILFLLHLSVTYGLIWSKEALREKINITFVSNLPIVIFLYGFLYLLKSKVHIRTVEFHIHKYDRWNYANIKYDTFYIIEQIELYQNFTYYKNTGTSTNMLSPLELENYCNNLPEENEDFIGYNTKEEAMKIIFKTVKNIIKEEKYDVNIKVKNVGTVEIFTIEELKKIIENE